MHMKNSCLLLALAICLVALFGCSRESSITEDTRLKNNHSIVFAFDHPFENPETFADSIRTIDISADSIPDTITVTIGDSIYLMGFLPLYAEKIYRFEWIFEKTSKEDSDDDDDDDDDDKKSSKDSVITSENVATQSWAYEKAGVYFPIFRAIDGNNAIDTAGIHHRPLYIKVIDTPPILSVPRDTVKARHEKSATFNIWAADSFGTIVKAKVDYDGDGKDSAQTIDMKKEKDSDSITVKVPFKKAYVDSLGNQTVHIIVVDDDGNETKEAVHLHFNQLPTIELLQPLDEARFSSQERFAFYYRAEDSDNPGSLRYFIRVAKSPDGRNPPIFTDPEENLVASGITEKSFEVIDTAGVNLIGLSGILYWDVWVTDGYDTVFAEHIKDGDKTRPWKFFLGNLDNTFGNFYGYAKYEGWTNHHNGIRIVMQDTLGNSYYGSTKASGLYSLNVPPGIYNVWAIDTSGYRFAKDTLMNQLVVADDTTKGRTMTLADTSRPIIVFNDEIDTLNVRDYQLSLKLYDFGSQVASALATFDGDTTDCDYFSTNSWTKNFTGLSDGKHSLKLVVKDSAGLASDTFKLEFVVAATSIHIAVNGLNTTLQSDAASWAFSAIASETTIADSLIWVSNVPGFKQKTQELVDFKDTLKFANAAEIGTLETGTFYEMYAMTQDGVKSNTVKFGILGNDPIIYFEKPSNDTTITLNDAITFSIFLYTGEGGSGDATITQTGDGSNRNFSGGTIPSGEDQTIHWSKAGQKKIIVSYTNGKTVNDTLRVNVIEDPPSIRVTTGEIDNRHKINSFVDMTVSASDKFGTVNKIEWGCSNNLTLLTFDESIVLTDPAKSVSDIPISVHMPGEAADDYKCVVRAIDDDDQASSDTLHFKVLQDLPYISLNVKNQTFSIKDQTSLSFVAVDTLGHIETYEYSCDSIKSNLKNGWMEFDGKPLTVTMPPEACTWYCAIQVTDDDGNKSRDTATYTILLDPPSVQVIGNYTATIKDTVGLDAIANDKYGKIALYEWGCGSADAQNIGFTYSSTTSPAFNAVMPAVAQNGYKCIIRVTDDDGNTARDTAFVDIILAPPTVVVTNESAIVREGYNIVLDASDYDYPDFPGFIETREWSCGTPYDIPHNWKVVSQFDTVWKAPAASAAFYCVARVTDNDGNTATDTMTINFSTDLPIISVKDEVVYVIPGEAFELNASVNDVWQGISWFTWECVDANTGKSMEDNVTKYDYYKNNKSFYDFRDEAVTSKGKDMLCIVSAEESSTKATFSDTTKVYMIHQAPEGVITAADTVYPWSGDESFSDEVVYFYTTEWGGQNSVLGTVGDEDKQDFWWNFSNVDGNYYQGNPDGSLDTSTYEFNSAFIRSTRENSITICLDYRDSTAEQVTQAFYTKHRAQEVCRKVYFRKAWRNQAASKDTVLALAKFTTPPVITTIDNKPVIAYLTGNTTVTTKYLDGSTWKSLSTASISASDSITSLKIATGGSDLYLAVLTQAGKLSIYKSSSGTSPWTSVGESTTGASAINLLCNPNDGKPLVTYIKTSDKTAKFIRWDGSAWKTVSIPTTNSVKVREVAPAFTGSGSLAIVYVDTTTSYQAYYVLYNSSFEVKKKDSKIASNVNGVDLAADGSTLYMGFLNRDTEKYGPYVYKGEASSSSISWTTSGAFGKSIHEGLLAYHISIAVGDGKLYAIVDDKGKPSLAQSHVFYLDGSTWKLMGENELPYFKTNFYSYNKYYLRGSVPNIAVTANGKVYISMLGWENAGGSGKNFGPIVMKYVADNWPVH